jgi:hypothetical protein
MVRTAKLTPMKVDGWNTAFRNLPKIDEIRNVSNIVKALLTCPVRSTDLLFPDPLQIRGNALAMTCRLLLKYEMGKRGLFLMNEQQLESFFVEKLKEVFPTPSYNFVPYLNCNPKGNMKIVTVIMKTYFNAVTLYLL